MFQYSNRLRPHSKLEKIRKEKPKRKFVNVCLRPHIKDAVANFTSIVVIAKVVSAPYNIVQIMD